MQPQIIGVRRPRVDAGGVDHAGLHHTKRKRPNDVIIGHLLVSLIRILYDDYFPRMENRHTQHSKTLRGFVRKLMRDGDLDSLGENRHEIYELREALEKLDESLIDGRHYSWGDFLQLLSEALEGAAFKQGVGLVVPEEGHGLTATERKRSLIDDAKRQLEELGTKPPTEEGCGQRPENREKYAQRLSRAEYYGSDYASITSAADGSRETPMGVRSGSGDGSPWGGSNGKVDVTRPNGPGLAHGIGHEMSNGVGKVNGGGGSRELDDKIAEAEREFAALKTNLEPTRAPPQTSDAIEAWMATKEEAPVSRDGFERKAPLTREQDEEVDECLGGGPPNEVVARGYNAEITRQQMMCLQPMTWLNDEIINMYMKLLDARDKELCETDPSRRRSHFFSSFFVTKLTENKYNYTGVRRWTRRVKVFNMDKIFCPVNLSNMHWCMTVIYMQEKRICYYDSMGGKGSRITGALMTWLEDEDEDKNSSDGTFDPDEWRVEGTNLATTPQQENGSDCGAFACTFAAYLTDNLPFSFGQADMLNIRRRIAWNVLKQRLV